MSRCSTLWNSAFRRVYLSFSPLSFTSLLFSPVCKAFSDNRFAFYQMVAFLQTFCLLVSYIHMFGNSTSIFLLEYSKSPTYEQVPFLECVHKSSKVSLGAQLTQSAL